MLVEGGNPTPTLKRDNQLPPPGVHRLRRRLRQANSLTCALSAGRSDQDHRLESVRSPRPARHQAVRERSPVRCTLFVDVSNSVRVPTVHGRAPAGLSRSPPPLCEPTAMCAILPGSCLFDEYNPRCFPLTAALCMSRRLLQTLADAAALARRRPGRSRSADPVGLRFRSAVYPEPMRQTVNDMPFWQEWFDSTPGYTRRKFSLTRPF